MQCGVLEHLHGKVCELHDLDLGGLGQYNRCLRPFCFTTER